MLKYIGSFILFYISYIPLFIIITIKNFEFIISNNSITMIFVGIGISYILSMVLLWFIINSLKSGSPRPFEANLLVNKNSEVLNYLFVYILPLISIDINNIFEISSFIFLFILIAYISIRNGILHINPVLNIVFRYNIYSFKNDNGSEQIILTKKNQLELTRHKSIQVVPFHKDIFLDIDKNKKVEKKSKRN